MKPKLLVTITAFVIACAIAWFTSGLFWGNSSLDINFHDTYFIITPFQLFLFIKLVLLLVFGVRCIVGRFLSRFDNCFLLISLFLVQQAYISIGIILNQLNFSFSGLASSPSLSALPKAMPSPVVLSPAGPILLAIQIIFTILLVIVAIITGRNWNKAAL